MEIPKFKAGELVWHKKHNRPAVVVEQSKFRQWVQVLFVGESSPHEAYACFLERVEVNNEN